MVDYNVQYQIPQIQVRAPGRQNRAISQTLRITPGMTEPINFILGNRDGKPYILLGYTIKFIVWAYDDMDSPVLYRDDRRVVLSKTILITDPYCNSIPLVLTTQDTQKLGFETSRGLRWSLFLIDSQKQIYPLRVSSRGGRYGTFIFDQESGMPPTEIILGS